MKKIILLSLSVATLLNATTMQDLFEALKKNPTTQGDELVIKKSSNAIDQASANLYPKIDIFASYDNYSTPTNLRPVPPSESSKFNNPTVAQPFSKDISKIGAKFSMPLYIKSIYTMIDKAKVMQKSANMQKRLKLLQNEAILVGANANLNYLTQLKKSIELKKRSLVETSKTIKIKVNNGRLAASALYKIEDGINEIDIVQNNIALQEQKIISTITTLTGIIVENPIDMNQQNSKLNRSNIFALEPLRKKIKASNLEVKAQKEKLYPSIALHGSYTNSYANAYNNGKKLSENYSNIGVAINIPLGDISKYKSIQSSKIDLLKEKNKLQRTKQELEAKSTMLQNSLKLLNNSISLDKKSIKNKKQLLNIAKVNYKSGRMTTEEYLRYEDDLVDAKAKLYQAKAQKWQSLMELAVIYGNNIEEIVR